MNCKKCGTCCRELGGNLWKQSPLVMPIELRNGQVPVRPVKILDDGIIDEKGCLMLLSTNECAFEKVLGKWAKPEPCRIWPVGEPNNRCRFNTDYVKDSI